MNNRQRCLVLAGLAAALLGLTGCGGINATGTASPAMFLLQNQPDRPAPLQGVTPDLAAADVAPE